MDWTGSLLITGSTGMAGREIARDLLTRTDVQLTLVLHDTGRALSRPRLLGELFRLEPTQPLIRRIRLVRGDLTKDRLGIPTTVYAGLARRVDGIIHPAAATRVRLALPEARQASVVAPGHLVR